MDNPTHTAEWLLEHVYELMNADPSNDLATIGALVVILNRFEAALGTLYFETVTATEKITGARSMLLRVIGAEPAGGHTREGLLQFAAGDLATLARQKFRLIE